MELKNIAEADEPVNWENTELSTEEKYFQALQRGRAAYHRYLTYYGQLKPYMRFLASSSKSSEPAFAVPVSNMLKIGYDWWGVPASAPNGDELWKILQTVGEKANRARMAQGRYVRLSTQLKKLYRTEGFNDLKYKTGEMKIESANVPKRIHYAKTKFFHNPYWERDRIIDRYAGSVGHFNHFTDGERDVLVELNRILKRNGLQGMTHMFAAIREVQGETQNRFVAFGANDKVIWKHVDTNFLYVDGMKVSMKDFTDTFDDEADEKQKEILAPLKKK